MIDTKFNAAVNAYKNASQIGSNMSKINEEEDGGGSFGDMLANSLTEAKNTGYKTESISAKSIAEKAELHELVTSVTNAELTLNTVVAVRDKVLQAYQDIIKMPI